MGHVLRIELFGGLRLVEGERVAPHLRSRKGASLLAYLALCRGNIADREHLASVLWPEEDTRVARSRLKTELSRLRRDLEQFCPVASVIIDSGRNVVGLDQTHCFVDVAEFRSLVAAAATAVDRAFRVRSLETAIGLYKGPLWPGCYDDWIERDRADLAEMYARALMDLSAVLREAGDLQNAARYARLAVSSEPLDEQAHCLLMEVLLAQGQPSKALRQFHELSMVLNRELGIGPGAEALVLAQRCLAVSDIERPPRVRGHEFEDGTAEPPGPTGRLTSNRTDGPEPAQRMRARRPVRRKVLGGVVAVGVALCVIGLGEAATLMRLRPYQVVDMGGDIAPVSVSNSGLVAATATTHAGGRAWIWDRDHGVTMPPLPKGALWSEAQCINGRGIVSGWFGIPSGSRAFVWSPTGRFMDLGADRGAITGIARYINSTGVSVGFSTPTGGGPACEWNDHGQLQWLEPLSHGGNCDANCINDHGEVVGYSTAQGGVRRATRWDARHGVTEIGTLPGEAESIAYHINNRGVVVGRAGVRAFIWDSARGIRELEPPTGETACALSINDSGQAVGWYEEPAGRRRACLWESDGKAVDLNRLVKHDSEWVLMEAVSINGRGEIVGNGLHNDHPSGFLLVPRVTPSALHMRLRN